MDILGTDKLKHAGEDLLDKAGDEAKEAGTAVVAAGEEAATRVIKITTDWAQTHRLKISGSGSFELHVELVPKDIGPQQ